MQQQFSLFFLQCLCILRRQSGHLIPCAESRPTHAQPEELAALFSGAYACL